MSDSNVGNSFTPGLDGDEQEDYNEEGSAADFDFGTDGAPGGKQGAEPQEGGQPAAAPKGPEKPIPHGMPFTINDKKTEKQQSAVSEDELKEAVGKFRGEQTDAEKAEWSKKKLRAKHVRQAEEQEDASSGIKQSVPKHGPRPRPRENGTADGVPQVKLVEQLSPEDAKKLIENVDDLLTKANRLLSITDRTVRRCDRNERNIAEATSIASKSKDLLTQSIVDATLKGANEANEKAKETFEATASTAIDNIRKLEAESIKRNQNFLKQTMPEKVVAFMKWFAVIVAFVFAAAWVLERFV